jgi:hypothetical protein
LTNPNLPLPKKLFNLFTARAIFVDDLKEAPNDHIFMTNQIRAILNCDMVFLWYKIRVSE